MRNLCLATALGILLTPTAAAAQPTRPVEALGVRFLRGERLPAPFSLSLVSPTTDGLVAVTHDSRLAARYDVGREPRSWTEYFLPDDVLQWTAGVNALLAWLNGPAGANTPSPMTLGASDGVFLEAGGVVENEKRSIRFRLNRCREMEDAGTIDPHILSTIASSFQRVALRARTTPHANPPGDALWYGHAIGCPARADFANTAPAWPRSITEYRPHQETLQLVVGATGQVEPGSLKFMASSDPRFTAEIRRVVPSWRFKPARRMAKPVRQVVHLNVGFTPPVVLGPNGRLCADPQSKGIVARLSPGIRTGFRPDRDFLTAVAAAFSMDPVADSYHGTTIRFGYDRYRGPSNLQVLPNDTTTVVDSSARQYLFSALGRIPALPASAGRDTVHLDVTFGPRCEILFSARALYDMVSMRPQGDGLIRIANALEAHDRHLLREPEHTVVTVPASVLRQFVDSVATLLPQIDTTGPVANGKDYVPGAPMLGTEQSLGLNMWLSRTGWIRAGFLCSRPGAGQARFLEVRPSEFTQFRRAALAAVRRLEQQPAWVTRSNRTYLEHELTCHPVPTAPHELPSLIGPQRHSTEALVQVTVDETGKVDSSGIEIMSGLDSTARASLRSAVAHWTFQPAVANGRPVRARTHVNLILHAPEADAVVLANLTRDPTPADSLPRTIFHQRTTPEPNVAPVIMPNGFRLALPLFLDRVQRARQTWPDARSRLRSGVLTGSELVVTTMIEDNRGNSTFAFIRVDRVADGVIYGYVWRDIQIAAAWKRGDRYTLAEVDLLDWGILGPTGTTEGNFLARILGTGLRMRIP